MTRLRVRWAASVHDEQGLTLVEVVVATFLLVSVVVATFGLLDTSTRSSFRAEENQTVVNVAQRELEELRDLRYRDLAITGMPPTPYGVDIDDPTSRIRTGDQFCLERVDGDDPCTAPALAPLVVEGGQLEEGGTVAGGTVEPLTADVQVGDITVDIYRFVVWRNEGGAPLPATDPTCVDQPLDFRCKEQDYKRAVVIVKVQEGPLSYERAYEEIHSDFTDPTRATLPAEPLGPRDDPIGQQFWLSDARCDTNETPSRHQTRDTTGTCLEAGKKPDTLVTSPPDDPNVNDPAIPEFFDYSTEIEICPEPPPDPLPADWPHDCDPTDTGLQMIDQEGDSCRFDPSGTNVPKHQQIHRWVSAPMLSSFVVAEKATLKLATRTIGGAVTSGGVCAFLFKRTAEGVDMTLADGSYQTATWPAGDAWGEVEVPLVLSSPLVDTVLAGERLGLAIGVDVPGDPPLNRLQFLYDHPEGESRLEVLTTTPLD